MKFYTYAAALYYKRRHTPDFQKRLHIVKCRHWSMDKWDYVPCWTVVLDYQPTNCGGV